MDKDIVAAMIGEDQASDDNDLMAIQGKFTGKVSEKEDFGDPIVEGVKLTI